MSNHKKSSDQRDSQAGYVAEAPAALPSIIWAGTLLIIATVFIAYSPALNGGFVLDDDTLVTENKLIKAADGLYRIWSSHESMDFWPLTNSSFWIEWRLWKMHPAGYHVTNLVLHVAESLMVWLILRKLSIPGAFLAALIFALHPVNVESAAWIAQRKNLTAMLFFLASILWYLKGMQWAATQRVPGEQQTVSRPWEEKTVHCPLPTVHFCRWYCLSLAAFLLAMLGKGSAAILPVLLLGIIWWLRPLTRRDLALATPFFAIALVLAAVNIWFQTHGNAEPIRIAGWTQRLLESGSVIWFYLYKALLPVDLAFVYPQWRISAGNPLWWLPLSAALVVTGIFWRYRTGWGRPLLFAWGFFCVALIPVMGFIDVGFMRYSLVADRYQHIAIIGIICLAAASWSVWRMRMRESLRWLPVSIAVAVIGTFAFLSWRQCDLFRNPYTLYNAILEKNPNCWMAFNNLSSELIESGHPQDAIECCRQAIKLNPVHAKAYNNLGIALLKTGWAENAIEQYRQAIKLKPDYAEAYINLASALVETGRFQEAIELCRQAISLDPDSVGARNTLGNAYQSIGQNQQAIDQYMTAISLDPDFFQSYINMGVILGKTGEFRQAIEYYEKALRLNPDSFEAHNNLGNALQSIGQYQQAIEHYRRALELNQNFILGHVNLGSALAESGRLSEAIEHYRQALEREPDYTLAYLHLAMIYAENHQSAEAIDIAQKGLELARSKGESDLAKRIEDWLNSYRAGLKDQ